MSLAPDEKAKEMAKMTEEVRRMFALPESEFVIQGTATLWHVLCLTLLDYHCSLFRTAVYVQGHAWVTPGYLLFHSGVPSITVRTLSLAPAPHASRCDLLTMC